MLATPSWLRRQWEGWWAAAAISVASAGTALIASDYVLSAALGVGALLAGLANPVWPLALVALAVPFGAEVPLRIGGLGGVTDLAVAIAVAVWLLHTLTNPNARLHVPPALLPAVSFIGVVAFSLTIAPQPVPAAKELAKWLQFGLIALAAAHVLTTRSRRTVVLVAVVTAAALEGAVGWYQFVTGSGPESFLLAGGLLRAFGTFAQPNPFAGYLALTLPLLVALALGQHGRWKLPPHPMALVLLVAGALIAGGIALSFSRGGWIAAAAGVLVVLTLHSRRVRLAVLLATPLAVVLLMVGALDLLPAQVVGRFAIVTDYLRLYDARTAAVTAANYAIVERMAIWQAAWAMFTDHLLLGVGAGNFDTAYPAYALRGWPTPPGHAHNAFLTMFAETGLPGGLLHLAMLAGLFFIVGRAVRQAGRGTLPEDAYPLALGVLGMLVALCVHNLLDNLYVHAIPTHLGLMVGAAIAPLLSAQPRGGASR